MFPKKYSSPPLPAGASFPTRTAGLPTDGEAVEPAGRITCTFAGLIDPDAAAPGPGVAACAGTAVAPAARAATPATMSRRRDRNIESSFSLCLRYPAVTGPRNASRWVPPASWAVRPTPRDKLSRQPHARRGPRDYRLTTGAN